MVQGQEVVGWGKALESLHERLAPYFARTEPRAAPPDWSGHLARLA